MNIVRSITQKLLKLGIIITAFLIINSLLKINDNNISNTVKASSLEEKAEKIPVFTFHRVVSDKLKKDRWIKPIRPITKHQWDYRLLKMKS